MGSSRRFPAFAIGALSVILVAPSLLMNGVLAQDTNASDRSVLDGVFSPSQASRGQQEFQRACASCHGVNEHTGRKFAARWAGMTLGDLFEVVSYTMPEGDPGSLAPEAYTSILAFFLKESGYKGGETDLPSDLDSLKRIRIEPLSQ